MKTTLMLLTTFFLISLAWPALAQCPMPGTYTPSCGRAAEAYCTGVGGGQTGNMINAMSWDGTTLGAEWKVWGQCILETAPDGGPNPSMSEDIDVNGWGTRTYYTYYGPGNIWLSETGPWAYEGELNGTTAFFYVVQTRTVVNWIEVAASSNISINGVFDNCPGECTIEFLISNATMQGEGAGPGENYPPYLCAANSGVWFDVCGTLMELDCVIPNDKTSWGTLKSLYR